MSETNQEHQEYVLDVIAGLQAMETIVYGERVAVIRDPEAEKIGSIIIPEEGKRKEPRGTVVAHGVGLQDMEATMIAGLEIGDRVMYTKYNPITFFVRLPDGRKAALELMHVSDLYLGWRE